jgi:hypothetical protein
MEKLIKIQHELKVPKGNFNSFGKYKYRSAEDILEAVKPILSKYKCKVTLTDDIVAIGTKLFLKATAKFSDLESEECVNGFAELGEHKGMSSEQCTGTASSYARKYALNGLFLIDETESDADSQNNGQSKAETPIADIKAKVATINNVDELNAYYGTLSTKTTAVTSLFSARKVDILRQAIS